MRILALALLLAAAPAFAAQPVALRAAPTDADGVVTLGDLFEGAGPAASVVLGKATAEGGAVLDAGRVQAQARAAGLSWPNAAGMRRIIVRPAGAAAPAALQTAATQAAAAEALVYVRSLRAGDVIGADDVAYGPVNYTPAEAPDDAEAVIGLAARRPVRAGTPVNTRDLGPARVIAKDDTVNVRFRSDGVSLSLQGKALTAAAVGESVRVQNLQSKTVIEAVAAGPGLALVGREAEALKTRLAAR